MTERGRGRTPGAKGTAFPFAQRPQRQGPTAAPGGRVKALGEGRPAPAQKPTPPAHNLKKKLTRAAPRPAPSASGASVTSASAPAAAGAAAGVRPDVRISKLLAERGLCSRREADDYIARGWVLMDGVPVRELGTRAAPDAVLSLAPEATSRQDERVTILLHKPVGYVSGLPEDGYQPAVVLIRPENYARGPCDPPFKPGHLKELAPAGRLDIDSTGLLVLTQDGRIARQLIGEDSAVEKEYLVRVEGTLAASGLERLRYGLSLDGKPLKRAQVDWQNEDQLRFVLREGKKRQIRRMCELVGLRVVGLKRVRMGRVRLGDLPVGQWRYLKPGERF